MRAAFIPVLFCLAGLLVGHREEIFSGFEKQQFDLGDTRFINYTLEHELRWVLRDPEHSSLWDRPYFWPAENVGAYADVMPGALPPYLFWRVFFPFDTAFLVWGFTVGCLNFAAMFFLLRRAVKLSAIGASAGAVLFAFSNLRINMTMHWQLFSHYWSVLCLLGLYSATDETLSERARKIWIWVALLSIAAQLWAGYYLGWFLVFGLTVSGAVGLCIKPVRTRVVATLKKFPLTIAGAGLVTGLILIPLGKGYLAGAAESGMRPFAEVMTMICPPHAWLDLGPHNWLYSKLTTALPPISMEHEQRNGLGFVTLLLLFFGAYASRKKPGVMVAAISLVAIVLLVTRFGQFTLWKGVYEFFPGSKAVRSASRIGLLLLIPAGVLVGSAVDAIASWKDKKWAPGLAVALFVLILAEQAHETPAFDRAQNRRDVHALAEKIPKSCDAFLASAVGDFHDPYWKLQIDAMWAELETNIPTINGYSGHAPPSWNLEDVRINDEAGLRSATERLNAWIDYRGAQDFRVCHVKVGYGDPSWDAKVESSPADLRVTAGAAVPLRFVLKNTGEATWPKGGKVILAMQFDRDRRVFGNGGVPLSEDVPPGASATVAFDVRAPATPGAYPMQWRLLAQGARWFGELPPEFTVEVFSAPESVTSTP